jgi:DNA-binding MltR family transcriptional regulator
MPAKLPALEKNILKYRAIQMVLLLHQVESLRSFVIGSIRASDKFATYASSPLLLPEGTKRPLEKAFQILVSKAIITEKESEDLQRIIDLRNQVGHKIHELVSDISAPEVLRQRDQIYDYFALDRFELYRDKISKGMMSRFVLEISFRDFTFEQAEATYKEELRRLHKRIECQYEKRKKSVA